MVSEVKDKSVGALFGGGGTAAIFQNSRLSIPDPEPVK